MGRIKKFVLRSLMLLLLLAAVIAVFLAVAGDDFSRWTATKLVERSIDRKIHVDGTFSLDLGLQPILIVTDVWIENAPWAEKKAMGRFERAEVQLDLKSLVRGIVMLPRLVVQGLTLDLERSPDGQENWDVAKASDDDETIAGRKDLSIPVLEFISLKDIAINYTDRESGRDTKIVLQNLQKKPVTSQDKGIAIRGKGSINRETFQIKGRFGSIEDALAATVPYPLELTLETLGLMAKLTGTVRNLAEAEGFDLSLTAQAPSLRQILKTLGSDLTLEGSAKGAVRLSGNLESLSVKDLDLVAVEGSGQRLQVEGSLSDLLNGKGLDLRLSGDLGPQILRVKHDLLHNLQADLRDVLEATTRLEFSGLIRGDGKTPSFEKMQIHLKHGSGAEFSLQGHAAFDLAEDGIALTGLGVTSTMSLSGPTLLEQALGTPLPDLGAIHASAELSWAEDWVTLRSFRAKAVSYEELQLSAEGRIGRLSGQVFDFKFDPQLDLSASMKQSRPLLSLLAKPAKEAASPSKGPVETRPSATSVIEPLEKPSSLSNKGQDRDSDDTLVRSIQQGLKSAGLHPGPADGKMGPHTRAAIEAYQAQQGLVVNGEATEALSHQLQRKLETDPRQAAAESREPRSPTLRASLPELGPLRASGRLSGREGNFRLDDLRLTVGTKEAAWVEVSGRVSSLRPEPEKSVGDFALKVNFTVASSKAFPQVFPPKMPELRKVTGRFDVQGSPKAIAIANALIKAEGPSGLVASAKGQVDTLSLLPNLAAKNLDFELQARSPSTESVSRLVGFRLPDLGPVSVRTRLHGSSTRAKLALEEVIAGEKSSLLVNAKGSIDIGETKDGLGIVASDIGVRAESANTKRMAALFKRDVPELGEFSARFRLHGNLAKLGVSDIEALLNKGEDWRIEASGNVAKVFPPSESVLEGAVINLHAKARSTAAVGQALGLPIADLGAITLSGRLSEHTGRLGLEGLKLEVAKEDYLSLRATGSLGDVVRGENLDVTLTLSAPDPQKVVALFGHDMGRVSPLHSTGRLTIGREEAAFDGTLTMGQTQVRTDLAGKLGGDRPSIEGTIKVPVLYLSDIGIAPDKLPAQKARPKASKLKPRAPLFSKERLDTSALRAVDLAIEVQIDEIKGKGLSIDKAEVTARLQDGNLRIHPAQLVYEGGAVSIDFGLNAKNPPSTFLKITGDDVKMGRVLAQVESQVPIEGGLLNLFVDLLSHGDSPHELASNLNGRVGLAVENAQIQRRLVDLLAVDLFGWTIHSVIDKDRYVPLNCMILRTTATNGTLAIDELFTKGQYLRMRGKGTVDLNSETLHMTLYPKKQGHFFRAVTPVRIQGDLKSPSISAIPYREAALIAGMVVVGGLSILDPEILAPALALDYLWVHLKNKKRKSPCLAEESGESEKQ